jgi:hypothetical protein
LLDLRLPGRRSDHNWITATETLVNDPESEASESLRVIL